MYPNAGHVLTNNGYSRVAWKKSFINKKKYEDEEEEINEEEKIG